MLPVRFTIRDLLCLMAIAALLAAAFGPLIRPMKQWRPYGRGMVPSPLQQMPVSWDPNEQP
jgi:hypothetical protein